MKKQFAVIGLGNFGHYLATRLFEMGHEVLGIDKNARRVQEIRDWVSRAVIADATDPQALQDLELDKMDVVVVSIGSELNNSILATLNVNDLGVNSVVARLSRRISERFRTSRLLRSGALLLRCLLVHLRRGRLPELIQRLNRGFYLRRIIRFHRFLNPLNTGLDFGLIIGVKLFAVLFQVLLGLENNRIGHIPNIDFLPFLPVF